MPNQPKRNHFVTKHLLKSFSKEGMILVQDKQEDRLRRQHIKNTAVIRNHNRAEPINLEKVFYEAMEKVEQSLKEEMFGGECGGLARIFLESLKFWKKNLRQSFFPFYKDKGIDQILSDQFGFEKILARMESETAKILRNIHDPGHNATEEELKSIAVWMAFIALNNPKFRKKKDVEQNQFYHPFAQMGKVISPFLEKISQYRFQLISCDRDIFVTSDFPMLFIQINDGDWYVRSPYKFARIPKEVDFLLHIPIAPNKTIIGHPSLLNFTGDTKAWTKFVLLLNGLSWDFADRFVYAKNIEELAIAKGKSGNSYPAP